ncbi:LysR substrate-binding domain-containing protein [Leisingera thetidis]|uniref:LysR substrate-binding domain-containing protein n=1 Tax=Leisingera thetidis TaxID=2930199 RepID=UPI0021F7FF16|nr:LysR substrate-binding domain-containing protein [Leisingera thetidis]
MALFPGINDSLDRVFDDFLDGRHQKALHVGGTTFAVGWLMPHLAAFCIAHPGIGRRIRTNIHRVDISKEDLHMAIRFGAGRGIGLEAVPRMDATLTPLCSPQLAENL